MTAPARQPRDIGVTSGLASEGGAVPAADGPPTSRRLDLDVPYAEKDDAKRLGARWDPVTRCWFVPPGTDAAPFARWSSQASALSLAGPTVRARVLALPEICYRCHRPTRSVVGVLVRPELTDDPDGLIPFDDVAETLAALLGRDRLADLGIGELRRRWSGVVRRAYMANGCRHCDAIQGSFPLYEALIGHRASGGGYEELVITEVDLPAALIPELDRDG